MKKLIIAGMLSLAGVPGWAADEEYSGNKLLANCKSPQDWHKGYCLGYSTGMSDGMMAQAMISKSSTTYCIPEPVTNGQIRDVFIKYMESHPEKRHDNTVFLFVAAMREAFPCSK